MNILILGPQGSGKGTQAHLLCKEFNFFYVSAGDLLRKEAEKDKEIEESLDKGELIEDERTFQIIKNYLKENNISENILFDGFPRSIDQFRWFKKDGLKIDLIILLKISDEEAIRRLTTRRMNKRTGEIYNIMTNPPPPDVDPDNLIQRDDDKPEVIKERLATFHKVTEKLMEEIKKEGIPFREIEGERSIEAIFQDIKDKLKRFNAENYIKN